MARSTPAIHEATLLFHEKDLTISIPVGSEQWFSWLHEETSMIFSFHSPNGSYTARKECAGNHRGGWYWKAYRKYQSKQYRAYLGKSEELTLDRLNQIALTLSMRIQGHTDLSLDMSEEKRRPHRQNYSTPVAAPLLETKLCPPRLPILLVERAHLFALLDEGLQQKLVLIHAPAGFGKTTLVAQWIAHRQKQATTSQHAPAPIAWVSFDLDDNDSVRFWSLIITACQRFQANAGQTALAHLTRVSRSPFSTMSLQAVLTHLLNDLERSGSQGVIILDDYHLITHERLHTTLTFFIEHLPAGLYVMILTRSEPPLPLVRWRSRGNLLEVSSRKLRFSAEETAVFLQQMMPQAFSREAVRRLDAVLEGWPAGLRLLTCSLQGYQTPQALENALHEFNGHVAADPIHRSLEEFFLSEIFNAQPEILQTFLLQTSGLGRITGSLCNAITGRQDSAQWLTLIERSGFFLEALDSAGRWYRYYPLWAATLRTEAIRRLGPETLRGFQLAASRWYAEHSMLVEAIEAALGAQEYEVAAQFIMQLNASAYFPEYQTMQRWIESLPEPLLRSQPVLCFLLAQAQLLVEDDDSPQRKSEIVEDLLAMAEQGWRLQDAQFQIGILHAFRATFTLLQGRFSQAATYARQALQLLPPPHPERPYDHQPAEWIEWHCGCLMALGWEAVRIGSFAQAYPFLLEAYTLSLHREDRVFTRIMGWQLGDASYEMGRLRQAAAFYQQSLDEQPTSDPQGDVILRGNALVGLARLAYERNELARAEQLLDEVSFSKKGGNLQFGEEWVRMKKELLCGHVLSARGEGDAAQSAVSTLFVSQQTLPFASQLTPETLLWQARLQIREGDLERAEGTLSTLATHTQTLSPLQQETLQLLSIRLRLARGETDISLSRLIQLRAEAQVRQHRTRVLEIDLLLVLAYSAAKQRPAAQHHLVLALSLARQEGFLRLFLDEGEPLAALLRSSLFTLTEKPLHAFAQTVLQILHNSVERRTAASAQLEALSTQEQRVLGLLAAGRSNPEIAEVLVVSVNTVKGHVKNLYRKLDVSNRREASEVARLLKLI